MAWYWVVVTQHLGGTLLSTRRLYGHLLSAWRILASSSFVKGLAVTTPYGFGGRNPCRRHNATSASPSFSSGSIVAPKFTRSVLDKRGNSDRGPRPPRGVLTAGAPCQGDPW